MADCCVKHAQESFENATGDFEGQFISINRMIVCKKCGNKRCPQALDCAYECSGSNELGQVGKPNKQGT
jgi:uncharacterized OB-fold protein